MKSKMMRFVRYGDVPSHALFRTLFSERDVGILRAKASEVMLRSSILRGPKFLRECERCHTLSKHHPALSLSKFTGIQNAVLLTASFSGTGGDRRKPADSNSG
jgi:hypothetical protein